MEFSDLPYFISLKIFRYLSVKDLIRVSRVCRHFSDFSTTVLCETKSIDFGDHVFRKLTPTALSNLISLCADDLKSIKFSRLIHRLNLEAFAQFECPRLMELDLGKAAIGHEVFEKLVKNSPNLQQLVWNNVFAPVKYPDMVNKNLKTLKLCRCDDTSFASLTGRCPQLKHLEVHVLTRIDGETFDSFFEHCPNLETLILRDIRVRGIVIRFEAMQHFWRLPSLRVLVLGNDYDRKMTDVELEKISTAFPLLEHLELCQLNVTNWGVSHLASLKNLHTLTISLNSDFVEVSDGIRRIAECGRLEEARLDVPVAAASFIALLRYCHRLRFLYVHSIDGVETPDVAAEVVRSLSGPCKRSLTVRMLRGFQVWQSVEVQETLKELEKSAGHTVRFENGYMNYLISDFGIRLGNGEAVIC